MAKATKLDQKIGEKIRVNRVTKKRSRGWLGEKIKKSYQQVQNYETGKHRVAASCLVEIAGALKTPVINFFPEKNEHK